MFLLWKKIKLYVKKRLKKDNSIVKDKIISFVLELIIKSKLFTGKKPPEEIIVSERLPLGVKVQILQYRFARCRNRKWIFQCTLLFVA